MSGAYALGMVAGSDDAKVAGAVGAVLVHHWT